LGKELFGHQGPASEEPLFLALRDDLSKWSEDLREYEPLAQTKKYPGLAEIQAARQSLRKFVEEPNSVRFLRRFVGSKEELTALQEDIQDLNGFYKNQRHSWDVLRDAFDELSQNRLQLEVHPDAGPAFRRMEEILAHPKPYAMLHQAAALTHTAKGVNDQLLAEVRGPAVASIQGLVEEVKQELDKASASETLRTSALTELNKLVGTAANATSIAHITQAREAAEGAFDRALGMLEEALAANADRGPDRPVRPRRVIDARNYWSEGFIENPADAEAFLNKLRAAIEAALAADERVQIK
jgi:hypothetical protein